MRTRPRLSATATGALIYIAAIAAILVVHSIALYLDRAAEDEPRTQASTQRQV
ncbi:hypothetical protein [Ralstonia pseudosolanacearum]|uniref:hypothetical protein n=1 Tax=Ralstonia pseudosolanacearum TaxID=1310165 RepID=UPI003CEC66D5